MRPWPLLRCCALPAIDRASLAVCCYTGQQMSKSRDYELTFRLKARSIPLDPAKSRLAVLAVPQTIVIEHILLEVGQP